MNTIIIDGRRELAELPEKWYTDGTKEANEWGKANYHKSTSYFGQNWNRVGNTKDGHSTMGFSYGTYITPSEFIRLVYEPWKESQKVELPDNYCSVLLQLESKQKATVHEKYVFPEHINACIQLTNIMNFANDAFDGDSANLIWIVDSEGDALFNTEVFEHPIRFTSKAGAEWAYKTFPEIFKAYWNV